MVGSELVNGSGRAPVGEKSSSVGKLIILEVRNQEIGLIL